MCTHEVWEPLDGKDQGFQVSTWGRVKGKLGRIIPPNLKSVVRGVPCVVMRGELRKVRVLVAHVFGPEAGRLAELVVLGEKHILERHLELQAQLEATAEALRMARVRPRKESRARTQVIRPGEDITAYVLPALPLPTPQEVAVEEAALLAELYRAGVAVDPASALTRDEIEARLLHLVQAFGPVVRAQVKDLVLPIPAQATGGWRLT